MSEINTTTINYYNQKCVKLFYDKFTKKGDDGKIKVIFSKQKIQISLKTLTTLLPHLNYIFENYSNQFDESELLILSEFLKEYNEKSKNILYSIIQNESVFEPFNGVNMQISTFDLTNHFKFFIEYLGKLELDFSEEELVGIANTFVINLNKNSSETFNNENFPSFLTSNDFYISSNDGMKLSDIIENGNKSPEYSKERYNFVNNKLKQIDKNLLFQYSNFSRKTFFKNEKLIKIDSLLSKLLLLVNEIINKVEKTEIIDYRPTQSIVLKYIQNQSKKGFSFYEANLSSYPFLLNLEIIRHSKNLLNFSEKYKKEIDKRIVNEIKENELIKNSIIKELSLFSIQDKIKCANSMINNVFLYQILLKKTSNYAMFYTKNENTFVKDFILNVMNFGDIKNLSDDKKIILFVNFLIFSIVQI